MEDPASSSRMLEPRTEEKRLPVEVRDCRKGAPHEAAKLLFAASDQADGNVLENTVLDKEGQRSP
jgi:hypothetical protein